MRHHFTTLLCALALLLGPLPGATLASPSAITPTGVTVVMPGTLDGNFNPHVSGDLATYWSLFHSGNGIVAYSFATNSVIQAPYTGDAPGVLPQSDVSGPRIVLAPQLSVDESRIVVIDVTTNNSIVVPGGSRRSNPAIGGGTVAFEDRSFSTDPNQSEIVVYDLATNAQIRLTNDAMLDQRPALSPDGSQLVWQKCQSTGLGCDIYRSSRGATGWGAPVHLTGPEGEDGAPDTNGNLVVYASTRNGETDIFYRPVGGGAETRIALPGAQQNPRIAGAYISFETVTPPPSNYSPYYPAYQVFVYDTATATVYEITSVILLTAYYPLPGGGVTYSDLAVLPDGRVRVVYFGMIGGESRIHGFTFQPTVTPSVYPLTMAISQLQIRASGATEKVQAQGSFQLAGASDGINPATQPVSLRLSTPGGQFYPPVGGNLMPINGFDVTPTGWAISAAERQRTGLQSFVIDRTATGYTFSLVDTRVALPTLDYSSVRIELVIGNDAGNATVGLINNPVGSGAWQLR